MSNTETETENASHLPSERANERLKPSRLPAMDIVRGVVMILMAIDHIRVYSGVPAGGQTFGLFFTRWITNYVAPAFVFLAGTAAFMYGKSCGGKSALSRFLLIRGLWLIVLELTFLRTCWTFNFDFYHYILAGVIWMIGWSMIVLSIAVYLPPAVIGAIGSIIILTHNLSDIYHTQIEQLVGSDPNWILKILYFGGQIKIGLKGPPLMILYVLIPWAGIMMVGYAFGTLLRDSPPVRQRLSLILGTALTIAFVVLRYFNVYGDPRDWHNNHPVFAFLNTTKYPASLDFLLMTLGPMFILWSFAESWRGRLARIIGTFGRVPMFYYLLHIPLIHFAACVVSVVREHRIDPWLLGNHPLAAGPVPQGYRWSLGLLYLVYGLCVIALYFPCRWYAEVKHKRPARWMKFI
jgi:uncharacterized membrane protein